MHNRSDTFLLGAATLHCIVICLFIVDSFYSSRIITMKHGSAFTVVRVMNVFNGKRHFGGPVAPKA